MIYEYLSHILSHTLLKRAYAAIQYDYGSTERFVKASFTSISVCMRAAKALARLGKCTCSPERPLITDAISAKFSGAGSKFD